MLIILVVIAIFGFLYLFGAGVIALLTEKYVLYPNDNEKFDAIALHTYHPKNGKITIKGDLAAYGAYKAAKQHRCPLIMSVGKTTVGSAITEAEIYKNFISKHFGNDIEMITNKDSTARDTGSEIQETYKTMKKFGYKRLLVVASRPHLVRIVPRWEKIQKENKDIHTEFLGTIVSTSSYFWEFTMLIAEIILPPRSKRREFVLNLARR